MSAPSSSSSVDWEAAYHRLLPRVYNFFLFRVGDRGLAEDLTAVTFERAWRARDGYRSDQASLETWLLAIARNVARDHFRRQARRRALEQALRLLTLQQDNTERAIRRQMAEVAFLLDGLEPKDKELLALKYGAALTNREIARLTGMSETNVGTRLHRILGRLRQQVRQSHG